MGYISEIDPPRCIIVIQHLHALSHIIIPAGHHLAVDSLHRLLVPVQIALLDHLLECIVHIVAHFTHVKPLSDCPRSPFSTLPSIVYAASLKGLVYLNCVMDLFARKIIAWTLADTMEVSTVIATINKAKACRSTDLPLIIHSDRGSQYVSNARKEATDKMQRSYSHSDYPYDNACIESFHSLIKREWLNRFTF